jgi:hypothetical protein
MTNVAAHVRIFDPDPTDDLVAKRTEAITEIEKKLSASRSVDEILRSANDLAYAAEPNGSFSAGMSQMIETAIGKSSEAFIADGRALEMLVCGMSGALKSLGGAGSTSGQISVNDVFALGLWSALSFQKKRTDAKLEQLRTELLDSAQTHCMKSASRSRERLVVPDTVFKGTEPFDAAGMEKALKPFGNAISDLRANAAVDREEIDLLWWVLSDWSSILSRRLSTEKVAASAAVASGLEAGFMLRRIPAPAHRHLVLRNIPSGKSMTLLELLTAVGQDRSALAAAFKADVRISQCPAVFPLARALRTEAAKDANAKVNRSIEDWSARALLEASICRLSSNLPAVAV